MALILPGAITGTTARESCVCATTANITISSALVVAGTLDGVTLAAGNRVLVKNQSTATQNGIYIVQASPPAIRSPDFDENTSVSGAIFVVRAGTTNADTTWMCSTDAPNDVVGVNNLAFQQMSGTGVDGNVRSGVTSWVTNRILKTNGTDGSLIQDSGVTLDGSNNVSTLGYIQLANVTAPGAPGAGLGRLYKKTGSGGLFWMPDAAGPEVDVTLSSGTGEANTGQNIGVGGVGVYDSKSGVVLRFRNINTASSKVTVVHDSANGEIDIDIVPAQIDHNALLNYVANRHIDHSAVSINTGTGLTGGGNITATRTINLNWPALTDETAIAATQDYIAFYDASAAAHRRVFVNNLVAASNVGTGGVGVFKQKNNITFEFKHVNTLTGLTTTDNVANNRIDIAYDFPSLSTLTTPSATVDWVPIYNTATTSHMKININNLVMNSDVNRYALFEDVKSSGTDGGTFATGAWNVRGLSTFSGDLSGASLSGGLTMVIPAGTFKVEAYASSYNVNDNQLRIQNTTAGTTAITGVVNYTGGGTAGISTLIGVVTVASTTNFQLQHRSTKTRNGDGLGRACGFTSEVYVQVMFTRIR